MLIATECFWYTDQDDKSGEWRRILVNLDHIAAIIPDEGDNNAAFEFDSGKLMKVNCDYTLLIDAIKNSPLEEFIDCADLIRDASARSVTIDRDKAREKALEEGRNRLKKRLN